MLPARDTRRKVLIRARMHADGPSADVCIRDVSARGLLIQASAAPPKGCYVEIAFNGHWIVGRVVWGKDRRFGVQARDRIDVHAVARGLPGRAAPRDSAVRPGLAPSPPRRAAGGGSQVLAKSVEFAVIAVFAAALVAAVGVTAFETLSRPFANVSAQLGR